MSDIVLPVTKIQKFCTHDGPGVRTTVFLKGCPLRCRWCHNPETQYAKKQFYYNGAVCIGCGACAAVCPNGVHRFTETEHIIDLSKCVGCMKCTEVCPTEALEACSVDMTVDEILEAVSQDKAFYGKEGGITVSGGEPMFHPDGTIALLRGAKENGYTTAVETCGFFDAEHIPELAAVTDYFLWDFKDGNSERHRANIGVPNERILENLALVDSHDVDIRLRCIMIKGVNMDESNFEKLVSVYHSLRHCSSVELLPYHAYGSSKFAQLGMECTGSFKEWIPQKSDISAFKKKLRENGVKVY